MQESGKKTFLGLNEDENGPYDIVILPIPYEITTSYREGTEFGPEACIDASSQVEFHTYIYNICIYFEYMYIYIYIYMVYIYISCKQDLFMLYTYIYMYI